MSYVFDGSTCACTFRRCLHDKDPLFRMFLVLLILFALGVELFLSLAAVVPAESRWTDTSLDPQLSFSSPARSSSLFLTINFWLPWPVAMELSRVAIHLSSQLQPMSVSVPSDVFICLFLEQILSCRDKIDELNNEFLVSHLWVPAVVVLYEVYLLWEGICKCSLPPGQCFDSVLNSHSWYAAAHCAIVPVFLQNSKVPLTCRLLPQPAWGNHLDYLSDLTFGFETWVILAFCCVQLLITGILSSRTDRTSTEFPVCTSIDVLIDSAFSGLPIPMEGLSPPSALVNLFASSSLLACNLSRSVLSLENNLHPGNKSN